MILHVICLNIFINLLRITYGSYVDADAAEETQHAICRVVAQDIETSANATITRQIKGVCTSKQIDEKFKHLEEMIRLELSKIKLMLESNSNNYQTTSESITIMNKREYDYYDGEDANQSISTDVVQREPRDIDRDSEIKTFNNTYQRINNKNVFIYYWKIEKFGELLKRQGIHIRSPDFVILGHDLCLQLYPNHQGSNYIAIQLRPRTNFMKKHDFSILNWNSNNLDLTSPVMGALDASDLMFKVPNKIFEQEKYVESNSIVVKFRIYIDS